MSQASGTPPRTYGNWRRPVTAGILGLGRAGTYTLLVGLLVAVLLTILTTLFVGLGFFVVLAAVLAAVVSKDRHHRSLVMRVGERLVWLRSRSTGANLYRSGALARAGFGSGQLPGLAAQSSLTEYLDSYGSPFAVIGIPSTGDLTIVIETSPDGSSLVDQDQVDVWVAEWGQWLAALGDEPGVVGAAVTIETAPDTGARLRTEVEQRIDPNAPPFARRVLEEVVASYPIGSATVKAYVSITFSAIERGGRRRPVDEFGAEIASRLRGLTQRLSATGAGTARPLGAQELCEVIRIAYDPAVAVLIDEARAAGESPSLRWSDVGPSGAQANWDSYRHDSALSVTWQMTEAPRGIVQSGVLTRLLAPHRDIARKRVTWLFRPIDAGRAAGIVESDLRAANFNLTGGNRPTARTLLGSRAALSAAQEEAAGAGLVNFGALVTATVTDVRKEADARAAIANLAATARLQLRVVTGAQDVAFAAGLPLGLVLPRHLSGPVALREGR
ncbi:MAG: SCO6880 family protein [Actinomycetota bacterium]